MGELESAIDEAFLVDVRGLPDETLKENIERFTRAINRLHAGYLSQLEVLDRRGGVAAEHRSIGAWLRETLNVSPNAAGRDVHLARNLADVLPATSAALGEGDISVRHCQVIASLRGDLTDEQVRAADPHLAEAAATHTPHELLGFVSHVRHAYRPDHAAGDEKDAYAERSLTAASTLGGLGVGRWAGDAVSQGLIMTAIHAASAPQGGDDGRTAAQRRYDGLVAICERALKAAELPETGGVAPHVTVIVDHATLTRAAGAGGATLGFGTVISGDAARMLACDGSISRIITGPNGEVLDSGRATRTFTTAQRRAIIARDRHCRWPHCDRPSAWCDAHHIVHWADGGPTSTNNAVLLCGRHHRQLHRGHHHVLVSPDGTRTINTSPGTARGHHDRNSPPDDP
jgi:hypothetical protein